MSQQVAYRESGATDITSPIVAPRLNLARSKRRIVMIQTQAEGAGAQEISRILGQGLTAKGYEVHHIFFFRRTAAFDNEPNAVFCALRRPSSIADVVRMFAALVEHLRKIKPDAVLCFQHYGNVIGALAARISGAKLIIANRTSAKILEPRFTRWIDFAFGTTGLFKKIVVNSKEIEDEYGFYPRGYRTRVQRIDHGFESKNSNLSRSAARRNFHFRTMSCCWAASPGFTRSRNLDAAIRLLAINSEWHLALAGQGAARMQLERLAKSLGVRDRLHFMGELPPARIAIFLRMLDVFVFPSQAESFGLAVVEAAQAAVPVVANNLNVLREVLAVHGMPCALFVDTTNPESFAEAATASR